MTARRQSSTTSLQKYARNQAANDDLGNRSLEFCNAFWGVADGGYDVLLARIRAAVKTTEELRAFWKERCVDRIPMAVSYFDPFRSELQSKRNMRGGWASWQSRLLGRMSLGMFIIGLFCAENGTYWCLQRTAEVD